MREHLRLGCDLVGELARKNFGDPTVQDLAAAFEKIFVGRILNKRVLETIIGFGRHALSQRMSASASRSKAACSGASSIPEIARSSSKEKPRPITEPTCATSRAEPSRSSLAISDCWSVGGMAWMPPPCSPRSSNSRVTSSTNSGTPPVRAATSSTTSRGNACRAASSTTISRT